jgi:hypothetical protein
MIRLAVAMNDGVARWDENMGRLLGDGDRTSDGDAPYTVPKRTRRERIMGEIGGRQANAAAYGAIFEKVGAGAVRCAPPAR